MIIPDKICDHCGGNHWLLKKKVHGAIMYYYYKCEYWHRDTMFILKKLISKKTKSLHDHYIIRSLIVQFPELSRPDITKELIQMKRTQLKLYRDVKK